jgi:hypothetical protein
MQASTDLLFLSNQSHSLSHGVSTLGVASERRYPDFVSWLEAGPARALSNIFQHQLAQAAAELRTGSISNTVHHEWCQEVSVAWACRQSTAGFLFNVDVDCWIVVILIVEEG